jgi:hypothetical protein
MRSKSAGRHRSRNRAHRRSRRDSPTTSQSPGFLRFSDPLSKSCASRTCIPGNKENATVPHLSASLGPIRRSRSPRWVRPDHRRLRWRLAIVSLGLEWGHQRLDPFLTNRDATRCQRSAIGGQPGDICSLRGLLPVTIPELRLAYVCREHTSSTERGNRSLHRFKPFGVSGSAGGLPRARLFRSASRPPA